MTEQQAYEVLEKYPDFERRRYPDHLVAPTEGSGPFGWPGNMAFPRLAPTSAGTTRPRASWPGPHPSCSSRVPGAVATSWVS